MSTLVPACVLCHHMVRGGWWHRPQHDDPFRDEVKARLAALSAVKAAGSLWQQVKDGLE